MKVKMEVYGAWFFKGKEEPKDEMPESWKLVAVVPGKFQTLNEIPSNKIPSNWDWVMLASGSMGMCYSKQEFLKERR